ncbi:hypothetical protein GIB67_010485 [Kingdonia uniflora]|uniref:Uncharacterized protein n=1 Tax=Kingdonia uniflora TaxID=39325 RepID=A0A7J7MAJ3_9MAGN|nr:hypothetical protein GIB67_010485 [Kingdonia uniflora]
MRRMGLLDFTKAIDRDRERETIEDGEYNKVSEKRRNQGGRRKKRRGLSSLPDGVAEIESMTKHNGNVVVENDQGNIIRNHSVSGDLHGVQPNPVAADILRKEPEHETFTRLKVAPNEVRSLDVVEVYLVLQKCLQLRDSYLFREEVEKEDITEPCTPKPNPNPFSYSPETKTDHYFQMEDGVVHVYANQDLTEKLFPMADATTYFTDLHHILRVIAAGNIQTLCHHRLVLLEQKFNLHLMQNADRELLA